MPDLIETRDAAERMIREVRRGIDAGMPRDRAIASAHAAAGDLFTYGELRALFAVVLYEAARGRPPF